MSHKLIQTCLKSSLAAIFLLFLQTGFAQTPDWSELDQELTAKQKLLGTDLVAIIWKGDTVIYKKVLGEFNSKTPAPVASSSKWLTTAFVMQFIDEEKLSLDDKIIRWVPEYERYSKSYITVRHCLAHLTGIDDESNFLKKAFQRKKFASLEDEVDGFASRKIRANAGTDFWYGNIGVNIAGRVVEVIGKKKFDMLIKQKLFTPMGMRKTSFSVLDASAPNPSTGAQTTADDYIKFLAMLLNKGRFNGKQILSEEAVLKMMEPQTTPGLIKYTPKATEGLSYALGSWVIEKTAAGKTTSAACPGLFGTYPVVDFCRGYAMLIMSKELVENEQPDIYRGIKTIVDKQFACASQ